MCLATAKMHNLLISSLHSWAALRHSAVKLESDLGEAKTPAFQPIFKILFLLLASAAYDNQVDITADARVPEFGAAIQEHIFHSEPGGVDGCGESLREPLPPPPKFRYGSQALTAEFALLPFRVLAMRVIMTCNNKGAGTRTLAVLARGAQSA